MANARRYASLWVLVGALGGCGADQAPARRAVITLNVRTNMNVQNDLDNVTITVSDGPPSPYDHGVPFSLSPDPQGFQLPAVLTILSDGSRTRHASVRIEAKRGEDTVATWSLTVTIPKDFERTFDAMLAKERAEQAQNGANPQATAGSLPTDAPLVPAVAFLDLNLDGLCAQPGHPECDSEQICIRGKCEGNAKNLEDLPLMRESDRRDSAAGAAACFDAAVCYTDATSLVLREGCTFELSDTTNDGGELNVAAKLPGRGLGFCDQTGCVLPLDGGRAGDFREPTPGSIELDSRLCELQQAGRLLDFVATRRTDCATKLATAPICFTDRQQPELGGGGGSGGGGGGGGGETEGGAGGAAGSRDPIGPTLSSKPAYLEEVAAGVQVVALATVGDSVAQLPDENSYRLVGRVAGLGTIDNLDGSYRLLVTHQLAADQGVVRGHGARGSFVSSWTFRDFLAESAEDLGLRTLTPASKYMPSVSPFALEQLGPSYLAPAGDLFDAATATGYAAPLFLTGSAGAKSSTAAWGFDSSGNIWQLPRYSTNPLGGLALRPRLEADPATTLLAYTEGIVNGRIGFYTGSKADLGSSMDRAGLTEDPMIAVQWLWVPEHEQETSAGVPSGAFQLRVSPSTGFKTPTGIAWDPVSSGELYFATKGTAEIRSRLWHAHFKDPAMPSAGGNFEMLAEIDATLGSIVVDGRGHVYVAEEPGPAPQLSRLFRYDLATQQLTVVAQATALFDSQDGQPAPLTDDENITGLVDATSVLGPGWLFVAMQARAPLADPELVEDGQLLAIYDPGGL